MSKLKDKLEQIKNDEEQYKAYLSNENTVVIAGPGSGKTTVLTVKIMKYLKEFITIPRGLACVTFSNQACREIKDRLASYGFINRKNVFIGTVHAFCLAEIISPFASMYPKYNIPMPIKIVTNKKKSDIFNQVLKDLDFEGMGIRIEDMDKERRLSIAGLSQVNIEAYDIALKIAVEYEKRLHSLGLIDYEDIVTFATMLIQNETYVRICLEAKFPWIFVDEYQDLGKPLHEMILSLVNSTQINIFAVGDPDQSIYGFQGAIPDYLLELCRLSNFSCISLKTNYRSNQDIIDASEIALKQKRNYVAGLRAEEEAIFDFVTCQNEISEQYDVVVNVIIPKYLSMNIPLEEIAIMVATKYELVELSKKMEEAGYPFFVTKQSFDRSDLIRWLEDCARWVENKNIISFSNLSDFWIRYLVIHNFASLTNDEAIAIRIYLYQTLEKSRKYSSNISKWLNYIIKSLEVKKIIKKSERYPDESENLNKLLQISNEQSFSKFSISKFAKLGKPENQLTITTRHSSKGLEFEAIIILGLEEENFPSFRALNDVIKFKNDRRLKEERRVFFVCVSRAKRVCCLVRSKTRTIPTRRGPWNKSFNASRFWQELYKEYGSTSNTLEYSNENI